MKPQPHSKHTTSPLQRPSSILFRGVITVYDDKIQRRTVWVKHKFLNAAAGGTADILAQYQKHLLRALWMSSVTYQRFYTKLMEPEILFHCC